MSKAFTREQLRYCIETSFVRGTRREPEQTVGQIVELSVIWDAIPPTWRQYDLILNYMFLIVNFASGNGLLPHNHQLPEALVWLH